MSIFEHDFVLLSDNCVLLTLEHSLLVGRAAVLETKLLAPQDHKCGTVFRPISDYVGCRTASSGGISDYVGCRTASSGGYRIYSDSEATAQSELFLTAPNRNILTYLLTYLLALHYGHILYRFRES